MNATLEERLRRHYADRTRALPRHGPGLEAGSVVPRYVMPGLPGVRRRPRLALIAGAVAAVTLLCLVVINRISEQTDDAPSADAPGGSDVQDLLPAATLPFGADLSETPVTVAGTSPTLWYRLQQDLDIAWYQDPGGQSPSMLCWRTPVGADCGVEKAAGDGTLVLPTSGDQTLVVWRLGTGTVTLHVQLESGEALTAPLAVDPKTGWGVARFVVPNGDSITSVGDAAAVASEQIAVTGQTLPPGTGLVGSPITVPAGSKLNYWRWFPDLDISERAAAQGRTELCWRTPVGTGCIDDSFMSPDVGVIPTDGGVILLARPALVPIEPPPTDPLEPKFKAGPDPTSITVHLSDGSTVTASVKLGKDFGVWYARIDLAPGVTVVDATSS